MMDNLAKLMEVLGVSEEEAREIQQTDREIDRGANPFPLTPEEEKASKEARITAGDKTKRKATERPKKVDADKAEIISVLDDALCDLVDNVEIVNPEREIIFHYNGRKFKITLSAPRS